jgi:glycosyltransferase involved in cell wall biosynthesis
VAKNEERAIAEWLAYQLVIGFSHVVVYDNGSADGMPDIVKAAAGRDPRIEYRPWPDREGERPQLTAYADALARATTDWIACFDTDEFLVLKQHDTVDAYLATMPETASAVAINWLIFGSAGREQAGTGLVIDRFPRCAGGRDPRTNFCKSIVRRGTVKEMFVHTGILTRGVYVDSLGRETTIENNAKTARLCLEGAQLNHYLLKSREEFVEKRARGDAARVPKDKFRVMHRDEDFWRRNDLNGGTDHAIERFRPALLAELERLGLSGHAQASASCAA